MKKVKNVLELTPLKKRKAAPNTDTQTSATATTDQCPPQKRHRPLSQFTATEYASDPAFESYGALPIPAKRDVPFLTKENKENGQLRSDTKLLVQKCETSGALPSVSSSSTYSLSYLLPSSSSGTPSHHKKSKKTSLSVALIGDAKAGKTSVVQKLLTDPQNQHTNEDPNSIFNRTVERLSQSTEMVIWDMSSLERHSRLRALTLRMTDVVLLVFSLVDRDSLENLVDFWYWEVTHLRPNASLIVVGTKADERNQTAWFDGEEGSATSRKTTAIVQSKEGEKVARDLGALFYVELDLRDSSSQDEQDSCTIVPIVDSSRPRALATPSKSRKKEVATPSKKALKKKNPNTETSDLLSDSASALIATEDAAPSTLSLAQTRTSFLSELKVLAKLKKKNL